MLHAACAFAMRATLSFFFARYLRQLDYCADIAIAIITLFSRSCVCHTAHDAAALFDVVYFAMLIARHFCHPPDAAFSRCCHAALRRIKPCV